MGRAIPIAFDFENQRAQNFVSAYKICECFKWDLKVGTLKINRSALREPRR